MNIWKITKVYVVVNFLSQVIFLFLLFLGMVMYANEVATIEKETQLSFFWVMYFGKRTLKTE